MTKITFYKKNGIIIGFEVSGHTGKQEFGKDLLCCQISTIAQLAIVGFEKANANFIVSDGYVKIKLEDKMAALKEFQHLFITCLNSFKSVIIGEEKFAKLEVKNV